ncbi:cell division protein FtsA [Hippea sp. KM1]|uniref:cell division protein FtsA n=1 Tax=Hippea sp. KM1 TaxID=944481 RepID=UPI00046D7E83|nr:cell division protein FtsA [Hippea sp. KM1]
MNEVNQRDIVVGLDIGTTKVCAIVGKKTPEGQIKIIGIGQTPSKGLRKGVVINIDEAVLSIKRAVAYAERMSGIKIDSVWTGIAGGHIRSYNSNGVVAIKNMEVSESDIRRVIDAAKAVAIPPDKEIIHIIPQEFIVDDQSGIRDPRGMNGTRLEVKVHIVTGSVTNVQNIIKCCNRSGLRVKNIVLQPIASSYSILLPEEKDLGVGLIDIGGGTTDVAIFASNAIKHTSVLAIGGDHVTNDIAIGLRTPFKEAEEIKKKYGCALSDMVSEDEIIEIPGIGDRKSRQIPKKLLSEIIEPRMEEIYSLVREDLEKRNLMPLLAGGIVITGGSALMSGALELAERQFELPIRLGKPRGIVGLKDAVDNPMYATGVGLVIYGFTKEEEEEDLNLEIGKGRDDDSLFSVILKKMKSWVKEMF